MKNKKRFYLFIALLAVIGLTVSACGPNVKNNSDWKVKAKDGSGNVSLYSEEDAKSSKVTVPDGAVVTGLEARAVGHVGSSGWVEYRYKCTYDEKTYYVDEKDLHKQTKDSKAARKEDKREFKNWKRKRDLQILFGLAMVAVTFFVMYKWNKGLAVGVYKKYYAKKQREFPWLEKWLQNNGDPSGSRASFASGTGVFLGAGLFLALTLITYVIGKINIATNLVCLAVSAGLCVLLGLRTAVKNPGKEEPEMGLTLECPSCHCPHAWVMNQKEIIIDSKQDNRVKVTRSGYGQGDFINSMTEGFKQNGTTVKGNVYYSGRSIKDFECLNCGHTEHKEYDENWTGSAPEEGVYSYNPPRTAFGYYDE